MNHVSSIQTFQNLLSHTQNHRRDFILGAVYSFLNKLFDIAPEILIGIVIDLVVNREKSFLSHIGIQDTYDQLVALSILTLLTWGFESLFEYLLLMKWKNLAQKIQHDFRIKAYDHVQYSSFETFEQKKSGEITAILNDDINQIERFLNTGLNQLIQVMTAVILIGLVFFFISPLIAALAFLPIPIILWGTFYFQKKAAPLYLVVREKAGDIANIISNNILGMMIIRSFGKEEFEKAKVSERSLQYLNANKAAIATSSLFNPLIRMAVLAGFIMTFFMGGLLTLRGELNVGLYGVLVFLTQRLLWPLTSLADTVDLFERAMASVKRVLELLSLSRAEQKILPDFPKILQPTIEFRGVNFFYSEGQNVLQDIELRVDGGKSLGIVGSTGGGKSTLIKLLLGFYQPTRGKIYFGGKDVNEYSLSSLRQQISYVTQESFLFDGTIKENIEYGEIFIEKERLSEAISLAYLDELLLKLPLGIETRVGERGYRLSGGERQRISLARALLRNSPILILDEATSAVDNETERLIKKSLKQIAKKKTVIMIAHRLSTVIDLDSIVVLHGGKIIESGTHEELKHNHGLYSQLWSLQSGQNEEQREIKI